jgi:hypothetical protein
MRFISAMILCLYSITFAGDYDESYTLLANILKLGGVAFSECQKRDLEIVKIDVDLIGKFNSKTVLKTLSSNYNYHFICVGEPSRIKDIDIKVYFVTTGGELVLITKDEKVGQVAKVVIQNPTAGTYAIQLEAYTMQPEYITSLG